MRIGENDGPMAEMRLSGLTVAPEPVIDAHLGDAAKTTGKKDAAKAALRRVAELELDADLPLYIASVAGRIVHVNEAYRALARACATRARPLTDRLDGAGRRDLPASLRSLIDQVQLTRRPVSIEEAVLCDGRIRHVRSHHFPIFDDDDALVAIGGSYVDITEEAEALEPVSLGESRLRDFARAASDFFWETDVEGRLSALSERFTAIVGMPSALLLGKTLSEIGAFALGDEESAEPSPGIASRGAFRERRFRIEDRNGSVRQFHLSGVPVFDPLTGAFSGYRGAGVDMTERYRAERDAEKARLELETALVEITNKNVELDLAAAEVKSALQAKNEFLASMSHELRTPLNAVIGFAEAMSMKVFGALSPQYASYAEDILSAGRHLLALINDVLDVTVMDSGKLALKEEEVELKEIVARALNLVVVNAKKKRIDVERCAIASGFRVRADPLRVTQIVVNLLSNAVKFTPESGRVGVDAAVAKGRVALIVWDTGVGIAPDMQEAVFERFRRADHDVYTRSAEGTGLGLHISRRLAQMMGGDVTLESAPGKGSRFTLTLPEA